MDKRSLRRLEFRLADEIASGSKKLTPWRAVVIAFAKPIETLSDIIGTHYSVIYRGVHDDTGLIPSRIQDVILARAAEHNVLITPDMLLRSVRDRKVTAINAVNPWGFMADVITSIVQNHMPEIAAKIEKQRSNLIELE